MSKVNAYCGYVYEIPDKSFKLTFATSYDASTKYNYSNTFGFKIQDAEVSLSTDEIHELIDHLRDMISIGEHIPNKDNSFDHLPL